MRYISSLLFCLVFWTCRDTSPTEHTATSPAELEPPIESSLPTADSRYLTLAGTIGDYPVHLSVLAHRRLANQDQVVEGTYYYDRFGIPISLHGSMWGDSLVLTEQSFSENASPHMEGRWVGDSVYVGRWLDPAQQVDLPVRLSRILPTEGLMLQARMLKDSVVALPQLEASPAAYFEAYWFDTEQEVNTMTRKLVQEVLQYAMTSDSTSRSTDLTTLLLNEQTLYFDDYRAIVAEGIADGWLDTLAPSPTFNFAESVTVVPYVNTDRLFSFAVTHYSYSGGAHGNYGTSLHTIERGPSPKIVTWPDVFTDNARSDQQLSQALEGAARERYALTDGQSLADVFFTEVIEPTDNFALTEKGILFSYAPYEIAPYAVGEVMLFVPFAEVAHVLQPAFRTIQ